LKFCAQQDSVFVNNEVSSLDTVGFDLKESLQNKGEGVIFLPERMDPVVARAEVMNKNETVVALVVVHVMPKEEINTKNFANIVSIKDVCEAVVIFQRVGLHLATETVSTVADVVNTHICQEDVIEVLDELVAKEVLQKIGTDSMIKKTMPFIQCLGFVNDF
jgi:hypothetical protein